MNTDTARKRKNKLLGTSRYLTGNTSEKSLFQTPTVALILSKKMNYQVLHTVPRNLEELAANNLPTQGQVSRKEVIYGGQVDGLLVPPNYARKQTSISIYSIRVWYVFFSIVWRRK